MTAYDDAFDNYDPFDDEDETPCPSERSPDGAHCNHWYDGDECCFCGDGDE